PDLIEAAALELSRDGLEAAHLAVVGGAMDGMERTLLAHLRSGDRVAVEDPCYPAVRDLLAAMGMAPEPVAVDDGGPVAAGLAGDVTTVARVEGRQRLGTGWVSHGLQELVATLLRDPRTAGLVQRASAAYSRRRAGLLDALASRGVPARGRSGLNVWIPVSEE